MYPEDRKYYKEHEWVKADGGKATVGISNFAQESLGDIVFVELPSEGDEFVAGATCGEIESVKSVSPIYTPVSGKVSRVNGAVVESPELINKSPHEEGWLFEIELSDTSELDGLMSPADYTGFVEE